MLLGRARRVTLTIFTKVKNHRRSGSLLFEAARFITPESSKRNSGHFLSAPRQNYRKSHFELLPRFWQPLTLGKARIRVMEWKRRRAEEMKTQQEEQATAEQVRQAEADTEAARKLAATRAEEAERRLAVDREKTASAIRATEAAEKWAKATHQREQRRAKVYAINAVMRYVNTFVGEPSRLRRTVSGERR